MDYKPQVRQIVNALFYNNSSLKEQLEIYIEKDNIQKSIDAAMKASEAFDLGIDFASNNLKILDNENV